MTAAIYSRKSTDQSGISDEQCSVARQVEQARAHANRKGWAPSSVREVLHHPLYRGEIVWNQTKKRNAWGQVEQVGVDFDYEVRGEVNGMLMVTQRGTAVVGEGNRLHARSVIRQRGRYHEVGTRNRVGWPRSQSQSGPGYFGGRSPVCVKSACRANQSETGGSWSST
jgi:hypothetical protein